MCVKKYRYNAYCISYRSVVECIHEILSIKGIGGASMEKLHSNSNNRLYFVTKDDIENKILNSKTELIMLGTTAFGIPWHKTKIAEELFNKYTTSNYKISIIAESDASLNSDSLVSGLSGDGKGYPIAILTETRDNSTIKLREYFIDRFSKDEIEKEIKYSIEPTDDICRKDLDTIYEEKYITNICKELLSRGKELEELLKEIIDKIQNKYNELANNVFNESNVFAYLLNERDYFKLSQCNQQYCKEIDAVVGEKLKKLQTIESLVGFTKEKISVSFVPEIADKKNHSAQTKNLRCDFELSSKKLRQFCLESVLEVLQEKERRDYKLIKEYASKEAYVERNERLKKFSSMPDLTQRFKIKHIFHPIPVQMIKIDDVYYANLDPLHCYNIDKYVYIGNSALDAEEDKNRFYLFEEYVNYFDAFINSKYTTEETQKGNRKEIIYNYRSDHVVIGQMPRDSFYGSENYKLVMWALVFDREGKILIHKRSINAKDNQGMWDKSVGGHIAITDRDTISGASREIAEELYTVEEAEQGHSKNSSWINTNEDKIIYLGKWNEARYPNFATNLRLESDEFYSFSFDSRLTSQPIDSMRVLPDGTHIKAKCFVDLYFVVTSEEFDLSELKNSKYLVLPPQQIKEFAKTGELPKEVSEKECGAFEVTPDLEYIINSPEWDNEITKFSIRVKEAFACTRK